MTIYGSAAQAGVAIVLERSFIVDRSPTFLRNWLDKLQRRWNRKRSSSEEDEVNDKRVIIIARSIPPGSLEGVKMGSKTFLILREHTAPRAPPTRLSKYSPDNVCSRYYPTLGHGKNCRCKSGERSKGPKRPRKKRDSRCESAFACDDDKLRPPSAESSIGGACCSSSGGSRIKSRRGNSGGCGKEKRATHCPTTPSSGHCRFPESSQAKKKKNVAESCCGNCCDTRESDEAACCSNGPAIKCGRNVDACAGTASTECAEPCKKKKRKYKKIWKNFKSVWSRRTRREIAIERSFRKVVRDQSVNTCSSNVSLDYQYSFTECKMLTGILKHEKVAPDKSFSDIGCCTSSGVLPNYDTKSQESIRSSRSTAGLDESVATSKPVQESPVAAPAAEPEESKPSGGLFKKFARKSSKDKNSDKDSKTTRSTSSSNVAADKSPKNEQNTKVTIKETPSQSKSSHAKNPSQAVNKGVGTNDVEREKSKQNISVKEVSDGCQPKGHAMESKDFLICQCSKGAKSKIKQSSCGQDSCS